MTNPTIAQLEQQIVNLRLKLENEWNWKGSLTPEQEELRKQFWAAHRVEIDPLLDLKAELELQEEIKKALEENPVIKEVEKEVPGKSDAAGKSNIGVPATDKIGRAHV